MTCTEEVLEFLDKLSELSDHAAKTIHAELPEMYRGDQDVREHALDLCERLAWVQGEHIPGR